jgi:hypothetical protein
MARNEIQLLERRWNDRTDLFLATVDLQTRTLGREKSRQTSFGFDIIEWSWWRIP